MLLSFSFPNHVSREKYKGWNEICLELLTSPDASSKLFSIIIPLNFGWRRYFDSVWQKDKPRAKKRIVRLKTILAALCWIVFVNWMQSTFRIKYQWAAFHIKTRFSCFVNKPCEACDYKQFARFHTRPLPCYLKALFWLSSLFINHTTVKAGQGDIESEELLRDFEGVLYVPKANLKFQMSIRG